MNSKLTHKIGTVGCMICLHGYVLFVTVKSHNEISFMIKQLKKQSPNNAR